MVSEPRIAFALAAFCVQTHWYRTGGEEATVQAQAGLGQEILGGLPPIQELLLLQSMSR